MEWETLSSNRIKAVVSQQEFRRAGIDPQSDEPANIKRLKRYLIFMLSQLKTHRHNTASSDDRLLIEIYPDQHGGAEVHFIFEQQAFDFCQPEIFCFYNSDDLIEAAVKLFSLHGHRLFKSSLYQCSGNWLLIIRPLDGSSSPAISLLSEYGIHIPGKSEISALIEEHCKPILRERAVDTLCFYFD